jgi:hypothetical protein
VFKQKKTKYIAKVSIAEVVKSKKSAKEKQNQCKVA